MFCNYSKAKKKGVLPQRKNMPILLIMMMISTKTKMIVFVFFWMKINLIFIFTIETIHNRHYSYSKTKFL